MIIKTLHTKDNTAAIILSGKFTIDAEADFDHKTEELLKKKPVSIIIKMKDVDFIDSSGIGILMKIRNRSENAGTDFILFDVSDKALQTLSDAGVTGFLRISHDAEHEDIFRNEKRFK